MPRKTIGNLEIGKLVLVLMLVLIKEQNID